MKKIGISQKAIIVNQDNKLLILRRSETAPSNPLKWDLPGGDLEFGEDTQESIKREIKEEIGVEISEDLKLFDVESHVNQQGKHWVTICYLAKVDSLNVIISNEHDDFKWIKKEDMVNYEASEKIRRFISKF